MSVKSFIMAKCEQHTKEIVKYNLKDYIHYIYIVYIVQYLSFYIETYWAIFSKEQLTLLYHFSTGMSFIDFNDTSGVRVHPK